MTTYYKITHVSWNLVVPRGVFHSIKAVRVENPSWVGKVFGSKPVSKEEKQEFLLEDEGSKWFHLTHHPGRPVSVDMVPCDDNLVVLLDEALDHYCEREQAVRDVREKEIKAHEKTRAEEIKAERLRKEEETKAREKEVKSERVYKVLHGKVFETEQPPITPLYAEAEADKVYTLKYPLSTWNLPRILERHGFPGYTQYDLETVESQIKHTGRYIFWVKIHPELTAECTLDIKPVISPPRKIRTKKEILPVPEIIPEDATSIPKTVAKKKVTKKAPVAKKVTKKTTTKKVGTKKAAAKKKTTTKKKVTKKATTTTKKPTPTKKKKTVTKKS